MHVLIQFHQSLRKWFSFSKMLAVMIVMTLGVSATALWPRTAQFAPLSAITNQLRKTGFLKILPPTKLSKGTISSSSLTQTTFTETFNNAPDYSNNWVIALQTGTSTTTYTSDNFRIQAPPVCTGPTSGTGVIYRSKQAFAGDLDASFQLNHGGYGRTSVGLWSVKTNQLLLQAILDTDDTAYLNFGSGTNFTEYKYSSGPYLNKWITLRIQVVGSNVNFYADNGTGLQLLQTWPVPAISSDDSYHLAFGAASVCWKSGANDTSFRLITATGTPKPSTPSEFVFTGVMKDKRVFHTATLLKSGLVLVTGGYNGTTALHTAELYDPQTKTWRYTKTMMNAPRDRHTATLLQDGRVLIVGGLPETNTAEIYDPATETFSSIKPMNVTRFLHRAILFKDGRVLVIAGRSSSRIGAIFATNAAEIFDPLTGNWSLTDSLPFAVTDHTATLLPDGKVLVAGGYDGNINDAHVASVALYDPATGKWKSMTPMQVRRTSHTATLLTNGKVLIAGGNNTFTTIDSTEIYDPNAGANGQSTLGNAVKVGGWGSRAERLNDGNALLIGGEFLSPGIASPTNAAQVFNATTGAVTDVGPMNAARAYATVTLLPSGQVLIAGGQEASGVPLASAEIWAETCIAPTITAQPIGKTISSGEQATLTVGASGTEPRSYQWYEGAKGDTSKPVGTNSSSFTTPALTVNKSYWVRVSNSCGSVDSEAASITVTATDCTNPIKINAQPILSQVNADNSVKLVVNASGSKISYQWFEGHKGDTSKPLQLTPSTISGLITTPVLTNDLSYFWVQISNACGDKVDSEEVEIEKLVNLSISIHPTQEEINQGGGVRFSVKVVNYGVGRPEGSFTATNVKLTLNLDGADSANLAGCIDCKQVILDFASIPASSGRGPVIWVTASRQTVGAISLTASTLAKEPEFDPTDNQKKQLINVSPLNTSKTAGALYVWGEIRPDRPTIVLTHGLSNGTDATNPMESLWIGGYNPQSKTYGAGVLLADAVKLRDKVNIISYVWHGAFQVIGKIPYYDEYIKAKQYTNEAGLYLAKELLIELGANYKQKIHFVGHSLGTIVNAYAAETFLRNAPLVPQAQYTALDRPDHVSKIIANRCNDAWATNKCSDYDKGGFDSAFFSNQFESLRTFPSSRLKVENFYSLTGVGVGDDVEKPGGIDWYSWELKAPNDVGGKFFAGEGALGIFGVDNNHSGVQQWYRLTIKPDFFSTSICKGVVFDRPLGWDDSLNPCDKGWRRSILFPCVASSSCSALSFNPFLSPTPSFIESETILGYDKKILYLENFENIRGTLLVQNDVNGNLLRTNGSDSFASATIDIPAGSETLSFDYQFINSDAVVDNATIYLDGDIIWRMNAASTLGNGFESSGAISLNGLSGKHQIMFSWFGNATQKSSFEVKNIRATKLSTSPEIFEADLTPRPEGKKTASVSIADWVQAGRFASGLDSPTTPSEFQRADCAPRARLGDAQITLADWVQAGRYAAGLDLIVPAGGPTTQAASLNSVSSLRAGTQLASEATSSQVRIGQPTFDASTVTLPIEMVATGTENAIGFSLIYDPALLSNPVAVPGTDATAASLIINPNDVASGRLGVALGLPAGQAFPAGIRQLLRVTFSLTPASLGKTTTVGFGNAPVQQEVVDVLANPLMAAFTPADVVINNPKPVITALNPASAYAGDVTFTLGVVGTGFVSGSVVRWNGTPLVTTFQSATLLLTSVPSSLIASVGTASITVANPVPGGTESDPLIFSILNPVPSLTGLGTNSIVAGKAGTLDLTGDKFVPGSIGFFNGRAMPTRFISRTRLAIDYTAADIACAGIIRVNVTNPAPGGGTSPMQILTITSMITSLSPAEVIAGGAAFNLTINGMGFCTGARVRWNGLLRDATIVNPQQITVAVAATDISLPGTVSISVVSDDGVLSNSVSLLIKEQPFYEADVSPRPNGNGNGTVTMADWVQVGRFFVGLDTPAVGSEFQRADCAPKASLGDGAITISDWVQAGRYAAGLDVVVPAGGPTTLAILPKPLTMSELFPATEAQARTVRARNASFQRGQIGLLQIELDAQGNENAIAFSLNFDPKQMSFVDATVGAGANGAALQINRSQATDGRVGFAVVLPPGQQLLGGTRTLLNLRFIPNGGDGDVVTNINFSDQLLAREVVDANATLLPQASYIGSTITIQGRAAANVSAASYADAELAADSIASAFGTRLATITVAAASVPLPTTLGGTSVRVKDALGVERIAPLFFVSPTQINYQIPAGTADGIASVTITNGAGEVTMGLLSIARVAPGLFAADASGQGWAAAEVVSVASDGSQTLSPVARFDVVQNKFVAVPITFGPDTEQLFLVLFGTGLRYRSSLSNVTAYIGNTPIEVVYAGIQPEYIGLDQLNLRLPRSLMGRGTVEVAIAVDGKPANIVQVSFR